MDRGREFSRLIAIELVAEGKRQNVKQKQIAEAAGVGEPQMSLYTKGKRGIMNVAQVVGACDLLRVPPETITARAYAKLPDYVWPEKVDVEVDLDADLAGPVVTPDSDLPVAKPPTRRRVK